MRGICIGRSELDSWAGWMGKNAGKGMARHMKDKSSDDDGNNIWFLLGDNGYQSVKY